MAAGAVGNKGRRWSAGSTFALTEKHIGEHVKIYKRIIRRNKTDGFGNSKRVIQKQRGISG